MVILYAPFAAKSPSLNGQCSPKDYPHARELADLLSKEHIVIQIAGSGDEQVVPDIRRNLSWTSLVELINSADLGVSVDSFLQHAFWYVGKKAIVMFSISDPNIFGHPENLNLLVDRRFLRPNQFDLYYVDQYNPEAFVKPQDVLRALCEFEPKL